MSIFVWGVCVHRMNLKESLFFDDYDFNRAERDKTRILLER